MCCKLARSWAWALARNHGVPDEELAGAGFGFGSGWGGALPDATMYQSYSPGMVTLDADDIAAICAAYPPERVAVSDSDEPRHGFSHATDTLGSVYDAAPTKSGDIFVDIVDVSSDRVAAALEAELVLHVDTTLTWVIYEWDVNRFKLGFEGAVKVPVNQNGPPAMPHLYGISSVSYTLRAGKRYALGLIVGDGVSVFPTDLPYGRELSFGHFVGGAVAQGTDFHEPSSFHPTSTVNLPGIYTLPVP